LKELRRNLMMHYRIKKVLDSMSDSEFDKVVEIASKPDVKRVLESVSRDEPLKYSKLLLKPEIAVFFKKAFRVFG